MDNLGGHMQYGDLHLPVGDGNIDFKPIITELIAADYLSIGYHNEHSAQEYLNLEEWKNTLNLCRKWLADENLPRFSKEDIRKIQVVIQENPT